jgi:CRP/FNR family transcriptional regulator, cyclic AMP receptor protein
MITDQPNLLKLLCETRFAEGLPNDYLQSLCRTSRMVRIKEGEQLFREGTVEDEIFVLTSGHIRLSMSVPGRGDVPFLTVGPGELVGWSGLISDGRMTAKATAAKESVLIALSGRRIRELCDAQPDLGYVLMKRVAQVLSQRLLSTRLQLLDLFARSGNAS